MRGVECRSAERGCGVAKEGNERAGESARVGSVYPAGEMVMGAGRVAVLGDVMLDIYVSGKVDRISPEAPVPVVHFVSENERVGGAANVALNVAAIGGSARVLGVVGADREGDRLAALIETAGVTSDLVVSSSRATTTKTRVLSGSHHQFLRIDREERKVMEPETEHALLERLDAALAGAGSLVVSDYGKGCVSDAVFGAAIAAARAHGIPVLVDPKRPDLSAYAGADIIKPNLRELARATARSLDSDADIAAAARDVIAATGASLLLTMAERGMVFFPRDGSEPLTMPAVAREVSDVSGAGDTVIGVFASLLSDGAPLPEALQAACVASGIVVSKAGTATVSAAELRRAMARAAIPSDGTAPASSARVGLVQDWDALRRLCDHWRHEGLRVGFTNGCFDLLHPGHVSILHRAKAACDRLVVGLNSDASVSRLKGPSRPVQAEEARATVLAALADVDAVTLFSEDTPLELIQALQPDVLVKGADYTVDSIVGADVVKARGGEVLRVPLVEGQSTSRLVGKIAATRVPV